MEHKPSYEELVGKLAELEEIIRALRNQEVDAVVGNKNVLMLRLKEAEDQLRRQRDYLERTVAERTRELRELSHRLVDAQENERTTIGNELHDEIGQLMTYATLLIDRAARKPDQQTLTEAKSTVQDAISKIRNLSSMLSPRLLKSAGLLQALVSLSEEFTQRTDIKVQFDHEDGFEEVPEDVALASYRIVQESLTNVARHAKASEVKIRLYREPGKLRLEVADNGSGFNPKATKHTTGLTGMRERALALGGELTIESNYGQGTRVVAELPLSDEKKA